MKFQNSFQTLPPFLWEDVIPTPIRNPKLIHVSNLKHELGITVSDQELLAWLNGTSPIQGSQHISTRYAGHQFGIWAGQLGDGRAISLGEILTPQNQRFEIQMKGSGLTPFSRMGDGKAVIRSSVREYLCSEAMQGLGIPTTRVLALINGQDKVMREKIERSALVARVFPSNLRFGHFEMCFHFDHKEELQRLIDYARNTFFNGASIEEMLQTIVERTARLMASWQSVGFCHGVMNTDNMSLLGITIDYGPFGFMEDTDLNFICNHSDHQGRYAYYRQPSIGLWNLERLLVCFLNHVPKEKLETILRSYGPRFEEEYFNLFQAKLGLKLKDASDRSLIMDLMNMLGKLNLDFSYFFRQLSFYEVGKKDSLKSLFSYYGNRDELISWLSRYDARLSLESGDRKEGMLKTNPKYVLRNYIAQEIIDDVEADQSEKLISWLKVFESPFDEHPDFEAYALPTPPHLKNMEVSCSS